MDSKNKSQILVVDDDEGVLNILDSSLNTDYAVATATNSKEATKIINQDPPDLILLDVNLDDTSGLEMAKLLKLDPNHKNIPIFFMSGANLEEDRIAGYEAGGLEYISKPFNIGELLQKIKITLDFNQRIESLNSTIDETRQMAFSAMSQSGEVGQILLFVRDSFECDTYEKLGQKVIEYAESQQLKIAMRVNTSEPIYFSHDGEIARLDKEILDRMNMLERIIDFGKRSVYNFENVSLLVKNMPIDDSDHYGRIKDNICLILEAVDVKIKSINNEITLKSRDKAITKLINDVRQALKQIDIDFMNNAHENEKIMLDLREKIDWSFVQLGLSEDQEQEISNIINSAQERSSALYDAGLKIEDRILQLTQILRES